MADYRRPEDLLAHASWLRALAIRLVRDSDVADDLVQETWSASLKKPPREDQPPKAWLAKVLVNVLRMRARGDGRRSVREQAALIANEEPPTPELLVARAEAQRELVEHVIKLDEPYRGTVLMHFCEGMTLAEIARAQSVPAGTVRWRLKVALDRLREQMTARDDGRRALVLLAIPKGISVAQKSKAAWLVLVALLLLLGGGALWMRHTNSKDSDGGGDDEVGGAGGGRLNGSQTNNRLDPAPQTPAWLAQKGARQRRIAGKVMFRGAPVAGAAVELASLASESGLVSPQRRVTNSAGEFDLGPQAAMEWSVRATAPSKSGAMVDVDLRDPSIRSEQLVLELGSCDAAMYGTVRDASGGPIAKARLSRLKGGLGSPVPGGTSVATDDQGHYELCVDTAWPGWVWVEVSADEYGAILINTIVNGRVKLDFALVPEAIIVGRVVRDADGEPVPHAHVFVPNGQRERETTAWRGTFTDDAGRFRIDRVAPGRHIVVARAEGMTTSRGVPVTVLAGQTTAEIELRLGAGTRITGTVVEKGKPVAGAKVSAVQDGKQSRTAISQDDGTFTIEEVPRGELRFTALPYDVISPTKVVVDQPEQAVTLEVEALGVITGKVTRGNKPAPGADIFVAGPNSADLAEVKSGAEGTFEVRGLRPGRWTLFAGDNHAGAFGRAGEVVDLPKGGHAEVAIDMAFAAAISGRVVDQNGAPVPGISVEWLHASADDVGVAVTDDDGNYRATTMTGGSNYNAHLRLVRLSRAELKPPAGISWPSVALEGGSSEVSGVTLVVQLDRLSIAGRVVDANGAPVPDARVTAELTDGNPNGWAGLQDPATTTDVDGKFSISELSSGNYAVHARSATAEVTAASIKAGRTDVVLVLSSPGAIEGTLAGFKQTPSVTTARVGAQTTPIAATVTGTGFAIRDLSPGSYVVIARTASEAATATVDVAAGKTVKLALASGGTGSIAGKVRELKSGKVVEGVGCRAAPRSGTETALPTGEPARSDAQGAFTIPAAPAGDLAVECMPIYHAYSDGIRVVKLAAGQRVDAEVVVVAWRDELTHTISDFGADIDPSRAPDLVLVVRPNGAASAVGLQTGDQLATVDGISVAPLSPMGAWVLIANRAVGTTVKVTVTRAGKSIAADLVLRPGHE